MKKKESFKIKLWLLIDNDGNKHLCRIRGIYDKFLECWIPDTRKRFNTFVNISKKFFENSESQLRIIYNCRNTAIKLHIYVNCASEKNNLKSLPINTTFNKTLLQKDSFYFIKKANVFYFYVTDRCMFGFNATPVVVFTIEDARKFFTKKFIDSLKFNIIYYV